MIFRVEIHPDRDRLLRVMSTWEIVKRLNAIEAIGRKRVSDLV